MRALMRSLAPDRLRRRRRPRRPVPAGPDGGEHAQRLRRPQERPKPVAYLHPDPEEVLADTYGLMIYQESVMRVAQKFAGYSLAEADNLRKACGKKIRELMAKERAKFVDGCEATGYGAELGTQLFDIIEPFADYAFTKSHAFGYGLIAYQTAYLKAHYPVEYLAALLTQRQGQPGQGGGLPRRVPGDGHQGARARRQRVGVRLRRLVAGDAPPASVPAGTIGLIPFGLSAVRNVGEGLVGLIVAERETNGPVRRLLRLLRAGRPVRAQQARRSSR